MKEEMFCIAGFGGLDPRAPDFDDQVDLTHEILFSTELEGTKYDVDLTDPMLGALARIPRAQIGPVFIALGRMNVVVGEDNVTMGEILAYRETMRMAESIPNARAAGVADGAALDLLISLLKAPLPINRSN